MLSIQKMLTKNKIAVYFPTPYRLILTVNEIKAFIDIFKDNQYTLAHKS